MNTKVDPRKFALIGGSVMLAMGLFALIPTLSVYSQSLPDLYVESSYGYFLGLFAMNIINKGFLILMGIAGIACASASPSVENPNTTINTVNVNSVKSTVDNELASVWWSRIVLYVMGAFTLLGLFSGTNTLGGYWPIFGHNVWLNAILAVLGGYFGYVAYHKPLAQSGRTTNLHRV